MVQPTERSALRVTFNGVRGSTPCACPSLHRYGGNTSSVVLDSDGADPVLFDLGTGLRFFRPDDAEPFRGTALVSHLHWDHVQGLPFFEAVHAEGSRLDVFGPGDCGHSLGEAFSRFMHPPLFPIHYSDLGGDVDFVDAETGSFRSGPYTITAAEVPHVGRTFGYRVERDGVAVVYVSDHQQPPERPGHVDPKVLELCDGADLLIHDAQFTPAEFAERVTWGHCTVGYAVEVARQAGVKRLALFHHDPSHDDATLDQLTAEAADCGARHDVEVFAAAEHSVVHVG